MVYPYIAKRFKFDYIAGSLCRTPALSAARRRVLKIKSLSYMKGSAFKIKVFGYSVPKK